MKTFVSKHDRFTRCADSVMFDSRWRSGYVDRLNLALRAEYDLCQHRPGSMPAAQRIPPCM